MCEYFVFAFNLVCAIALCENTDKIRWDFVFKMTLEQEIQVINVVCLSLIGKNLEKLYPSNLQIKWVDIFKWVQKSIVSLSIQRSFIVHFHPRIEEYVRKPLIARLAAPTATGNQRKEVEGL